MKPLEKIEKPTTDIDKALEKLSINIEQNSSLIIEFGNKISNANEKDKKIFISKLGNLKIFKDINIKLGIKTV